MAAIRSLRSPPIREALIDIQTAPELPADVTAQLRTIALDGFDKSSEIKRGTFGFQIGEQTPQALVSQEGFGWRIEREAPRTVVQFRRDGVTVSWLDGYQTWEELRDLSRIAFDKFLTATKVEQVRRIAARFINILEFAAPVDFDQMFTAGPKIPPELPQGLSSFLCRVVVPMPEEGLNAIITKQLDEPRDEVIPVVLDVDVFRFCEIAAGSPELWDSIEKLRGAKNRAFFSSVTDLALRKYE
jgi:uncharacterized protein (TIGR04255 family)